jgi:hypothetical protein
MSEAIVKLGDGNWATKENNLLAHKQVGDRYLNTEFTVTRGTDATYVGRDGLIKQMSEASTELVVWDGSTTGDWSETQSGNTTLSANSGKLRATADAAGAYGTSRNFTTVVGAVYKVEGTIDVDNASGGAGNFRVSNNLNLSSQIATLSTSTGTFKSYFTATATTTHVGVIDTADDDTNYMEIDNVSVKQISDVVGDVPRIDFLNNPKGHLLLEPARTNLVTYSEEISQYSKTQATVIDNNTTGLDGTVNASKVTKNGVSANDRVYVNNLVISNTTDYSLSAFIKNEDVVNGGVSTIGARVTGGTLFRQGYEWNGSTLSITSSQQGGTRTNVLLEDYGNGWWKIGFSFTSDGTQADIEFDIDRENGTDTTAIFLWGVQTEEGSYATSYIPTSGTTVTRATETCNSAGAATDFDSDGGVLFAEIAALPDYTTYRYLGLTNGTGNERIVIIYYQHSTVIRSLVSNGGATQVDFNDSVASILDFHKVAVRWKANDFALWIDGVETDVDTSGSVPVGLNTLAFEQAGGSNWYGKVKSLQVYKEDLSDAELTALTS